MRVVSIIKAPTERIVHRVDLGGRGAGQALVEIEQRGVVANAAAIGADAMLVEGNLELALSGGSDGELYLVEAQVPIEDGSTRAIAIEVAVIDGAWVMPDGGAPMLSVAAFVSRVGRDQVLRLTDMGDGRIDKGLVVNALVDAQAQAEAHLAGRFKLPFERVPAIIEAIVADLARAGLYENEVPENVETRRKLALRNLEGFRDGKLQLGSEARPEATAPRDPVRVRPGRRAYPDGLKDYGFR
ncbi:DUF1320 domain-containing protein [Erythrobacter sp. LQ02-29]|uniref:DUF1320 domain-containing protein n=1 Tax=Erythrobacter sp. LQ02-29 TaxID=2920384 RepID=UPI001F4DBA0B|nr:DUF1320 domain-containing protein [Erythrobacter sp. LQ02-29]MCP9222743.1 DUF1320 domain-containing protein [Erythrobacter sp. LQ02-29]